MSRCKVCDKRLWFFSQNWKYAAYATPFDCCDECEKKYDFNSDYVKWMMKKKGIDECWRKWDRGTGSTDPSYYCE